MTRGWIWVSAVVASLLTLSGIVAVRYGLGFQGKTLFAWMDILIVPIALAIGFYLLEQSQRRREQNEARRRRDERQQERRREERLLQEERERAAALQDYRHQMNEALVEHGLSRAEVDDEVATLARARTHSILSI